MQPAASKFPIRSLLQALFSALSMAFCVVSAGFLLIFGAFLTGANSLFTEQQAGVYIALAWTLFFLALLGLPSLIYAGRRVAGIVEPAPARPYRLRAASLALLLWPLTLAAGRALSGETQLTWLVLPPLQILAVVLPLWWLVDLCRDRLVASSQQRTWGVLTFSLFITTPVVLVVEIMVFLAGLTGLVLYIQGNPALLVQFEQFSQQLLNATADPQAITNLVEPLLSQPWVILIILILVSGVAPLVEELLKPMAVWALAGRNLTPAEGFTAGAIAGAGFALLETLFSLINFNDSTWLSLAIGRAGTGLLHITTAALMGKALAEAWRSNKYWQLGLNYLAVMLIHSLWNAFSILYGLGSTFVGQPGLVQFVQPISQASPYLLVALSVGMFLTLVIVNFRLRGPVPQA